MRPLSRFFVSALLFTAVAPWVQAEEKLLKNTLNDEEVRAWLEGGEVAGWEKLTRDKTEAERQISRGKSLLNTRATAAFKGMTDDTPEARKAKGEALVKAGEEKLAALAKSADDLRRQAEGRVNSAAAFAPCPTLPLAGALGAGATELVSSARKAGYRALSVGGVLVAGRGKPAARDLALSDLLAEKVNESITAAGEPASEAAGAAVILAEVQPVDSALGAIVSLRLLDAKSAAVKRVITVLVPAEGADKARRSYGEPVAYRTTFRDTRNFLAKLGPAAAWSFEVEGDGPASALLKSVLVGRAGGPALTDTASLARLGGRPVKSEPKAYWVVSAEPETPGVWRVSSRAAAPGAKPVPVGTISLAPAPKEEA